MFTKGTESPCTVIEEITRKKTTIKEKSSFVSALLQ
jgi:hypothetical protein